MFIDEGSKDSEFLDRVVKYYKVKKIDFPTYLYYRKVSDSITQNGNRPVYYNL